MGGADISHDTLASKESKMLTENVLKWFIEQSFQGQKYHLFYMRFPVKGKDSHCC